jgi:ATP-binding protein involved in chromosome partitioning
MFGVNERPMVVNRDGKNKMLPVVKYDIKLMSIGFLMEEDTAVVWRGPMASSALKQFMSEVLWGKLDFLLFDMPPGTGDIQLTLSQTIPLTGAVIVTTPQDIALADARKGHIMFEKVNVPTLGFIENMSYYVRPDGSKDYIFGRGGGEKISREFNVALLGEIAIDTSIRAAGDIGKPIVLAEPSALASKQFMEISRNLINTINIKNSTASNQGDLEIII